MAEFLAFLFLVGIAVLAGIGAARCHEWLNVPSEQRRLSEREHLAESKIRDVSAQAQLAMLSEIMRRAQLPPDDTHGPS